MHGFIGILISHYKHLLPTHCGRLQPCTSKMSKVKIAGVSMERHCLLDMPYEILFEIFRRLPKGKLMEISKLMCSKLRDVAGDTRLWKNVCIRYKPNDKPPCKILAYEELYSGPWPVKVVDLSETQITSPVSSKSDRVVKVNKLYLSSIKADKVTMEAILAKYQCTELYLDFNRIDRIRGIPPETFSRPIALEVLSLKRVNTWCFDYETKNFLKLPFHLWLVPILNNCKHLKTLDLSGIVVTNRDMLDYVGSLPTSLEKLMLADCYEVEDAFFKLLAESTPHLRELVSHSSNIMKCPSLLKLQVLETLHFNYINVDDLYLYINRFPTLKTVRGFHILFTDPLEFDKFRIRKTFELHGIIVEQRKHRIETYPEDGNLWEVTEGFIPRPLKLSANCQKWTSRWINSIILKLERILT